MSQTALLVGGCPASYHRLEGVESALRTYLEDLGLTVEVSGIRHPDGGDAFVGDYSVLTEARLEQVDLLVLQTTGKDRFGADVDAIIRFVERGGALVGIHNASDSFTDSPEFVRLMGARFRTHPAQLPIAIDIVDTSHPITQGLESFTVVDELYLFADYEPSAVHLLAQTTSFDDNGAVPIAWTREQGEGRVFYLSPGHNPSTLADANWQKFFKNGVAWVLRRL